MTSQRRALVVQHRFPEHDRERGSLRVLELIDGLRTDGWHVTFCSTTEDASPRYQRELVRRGVPTHVGWGPSAERWVRDGGFGLAVVAFWHVAELVLDDLRRWSPVMTVAVDSIDLHFVREARRRNLADGAGAGAVFDSAFGELVARELEVYRRCDAVLCVSEDERQLLDQILGRTIARTVPLGEDIAPSPWGPEERRGIIFVGNFRHLPNTEALGWLCREVLPRLDPELLARHPLRVVGHAVDDEVRRLCEGLPGIQLVGWVPSLEPELHRARVAVIPLLHGAGVKGKTLQALMAGTPVVSTPIGVEGIDVTSDRSVFVRRGPREFADAVTALLTDDRRWTTTADEGRRAVAAHHRSVTARRLSTVLDELTTSTSGPAPTTWDEHWARHRLDLFDAIEATAEPGDRVLLVANRDDALLEMVQRSGRPVSQVPGADPVDGAPNPADGSGAMAATAAALRHLGAPHAGVIVALASFNYWWLHLYPEWAEWLRSGRGLVHETVG